MRHLKKILKIYRHHSKIIMVSYMRKKINNTHYLHRYVKTLK
jgi:hypothetical protein